MDEVRFFIKTIGCQMNSYDSDVYSEYLLSRGLIEVNTEDEADLILINTCAVRQKSVDKSKNLLKQLAYKKLKKSIAVCLLGCATDLPDYTDLKNNQCIDFMSGPLNSMVVKSEFEKFIDNFLAERSFYRKDKLLHSNYSKISAYLPVIHGCNTFCSYCIVPLVRGREVSVPMDDIVSEIIHGTEKGICEWTLLGQNVNHYGKDLGHEEGQFPELLDAVASLSKVVRLDFLTSHPRDFNTRILEIMLKHEKIYRHFHLPLQSGDDEILERMRRGYSTTQYKNLIQQIRDCFPLASLTTDIIVGFPGETEKQYLNTLKMIEQIGFDTVYAAVYSHRPGTLASTYIEKVYPEQNKERLRHLLDVQRNISKKRINRFLNNYNQVFITKDLQNSYYEAKTLEEKTIILFSSKQLKLGDIVKVWIKEIQKGQLMGEIFQP